MAIAQKGEFTDNSLDPVHRAEVGHQFLWNSQEGPNLSQKYRKIKLLGRIRPPLEPVRLPLLGRNDSDSRGEPLAGDLMILSLWSAKAGARNLDHLVHKILELSSNQPRRHDVKSVH